MKNEAKNNWALTGLTFLFAAAAAGFWLNLWGHPSLPGTNKTVDPQFTNTATVRMSAGELMRTGGDTSGLTCSSCHDEKKKPVTVHFKKDGSIRLPEEHNDLVMNHGRNNHCFNCHNQANLETLKTKDGTILKIDESTELCGSCHGPTLRDWNVGIHGRTTGFWDPRAGKGVKADCTSCHDAHAPAFPVIPAAPGPILFRASQVGKQAHTLAMGHGGATNAVAAPAKDKEAKSEEKAEAAKEGEGQKDATKSEGKH